MKKEKHTPIISEFPGSATVSVAPVGVPPAEIRSPGGAAGDAAWHLSTRY
jgi:hypothetical protein